MLYVDLEKQNGANLTVAVPGLNNEANYLSGLRLKKRASLFMSLFFHHKSVL